MTTDELLLYIKDEWSTYVSDRDRGNEGFLSGVYSGELLQKNRTKSPSILCVEFKRGGGLAGFNFSKKSDGCVRAPIDTRKSSWRPHKVGYSLRIFVYQGEGILLEGIANPRSRVIDTVTWQSIGDRSYQKATPFKWISHSILDAKRRLHDRVSPQDNSHHQLKRRKGLSLRNDPQPPIKTQESKPESKINIKPTSQVLGDRSSMGSLGVFKDEAEAARASNYHKLHGKYPAEIQHRMVEKGLMQLPNKDKLTWNAIKETYDGARRKGGDGSLHENEREKRIRNWLEGIILPETGASPTYKSSTTPQKPATMPPPHPQPDDSSNHRAKHWNNSSSTQMQINSSSSPTYGM